MKNIFWMFIVCTVMIVSSCTDPAKDPLQIDKLTKGSVLSLRGAAFDNLSNAKVFKGAIDTFSLTNDFSKENFEFEADFIAEDIDGLAKVEVYASADEKSKGEKVATIEASSFAIPDKGKYKRAAFKIPLSAILAGAKRSAATLSSGDYLFIRSDLTLKNGTVVPYTDLVNSALYETAFFYPAVDLLYLVR
jgi:hypothetical protein